MSSFDGLMWNEELCALEVEPDVVTRHAQERALKVASRGLSTWKRLTRAHPNLVARETDEVVEFDQRSFGSRRTHLQVVGAGHQVFVNVESGAQIAAHRSAIVDRHRAAWLSIRPLAVDRDLQRPAAFAADLAHLDEFHPVRGANRLGEFVELLLSL